MATACDHTIPLSGDYTAQLAVYVLQLTEGASKIISVKGTGPRGGDRFFFPLTTGEAQQLIDALESAIYHASGEAEHATRAGG